MVRAVKCVCAFLSEFVSKAYLLWSENWCRVPSVSLACILRFLYFYRFFSAQSSTIHFFIHSFSIFHSVDSFIHIFAQFIAFCFFSYSSLVKKKLKPKFYVSFFSVCYFLRLLGILTYFYVFFYFFNFNKNLFSTFSEFCIFIKFKNQNIKNADKKQNKNFRKI